MEFEQKAGLASAGVNEIGCRPIIGDPSRPVWQMMLHGAQQPRLDQFDRHGIMNSGNGTSLIAVMDRLGS
jgi:hypothetical protein